MDFKFNSVSATPNNPNWNNLISRQDDLYKKGWKMPETFSVKSNSKEIMTELYIVMRIED